MKLRDCRFLIGPNILWHRPCSVLEIAAGPHEDREEAIRLWGERARRLLDAVGWNQQELSHRLHARGFSVALSAPAQACDIARAINEAAWAEVVEVLGGRAAATSQAAVDSWQGQLEARADTAFVALEATARERGRMFFADEQTVTVGSGRGALSWPVAQVPALAEIDWSRIHNIPTAWITGSHGKSTVAHLLSAMVCMAGKVPGTASSDGVRVGEQMLDSEASANARGTRRVLADPRVEVAILEVSYRSLQQQGLGVELTDTALITQIAAAAGEERGGDDLEELTHAHFMVERAARRLVLNADDERIRWRRPQMASPDSWFSIEPFMPEVRDALAAGARFAFLEDGWLVFAEPGRRKVVAMVEEVPIAIGGVARHHVANALAAIALARDLGLPWGAIRRGLKSFPSSPAANPGRLNLFDLGETRVLVDSSRSLHAPRAPRSRLCERCRQSAAC